jgi:hypothetical protein
MANPSVFVKAIEVTLDEYRKHNERSPLIDVSIWHSIKYWADDEDYVFTSTPEEIFDRLIEDNYRINFGEYFFGIDFETIDDKVLEYILNNRMAFSTTEPPVCTCEVKPCLCEDEWQAAIASR